MKEAVAGVPLGQFAAMIAALAEAFPLRAVLSVEEIDGASWDKADVGWTERLDRDPNLRSSYEAEVAAVQTRLRAGGKPRLPRSGAGRAREGAVRAAAPTFLAMQPVPMGTEGSEWVEAALVEEPDDLSQTGTGVGTPSTGRVLPFQPLERPRMPPPEESTRTSFLAVSTPLPFLEAGEAGPPPPSPPPSQPSDPDAPGETQAIRFVPGAKLPFAAGRPGKAPRKPTPPKPAASGEPPKPAAEEPPMTLERHASMCLEIALDPARTDEVLERYEVTPEVRSRADAYYRAHLAADADMAARWHHAYASYHAWLTSRSNP